MYGQGTAPPPPPPATRGTVIGLRVLFAVLPVITFGLGAWGSMLRVALQRRRTLDWALTVIVGAVGVGGFVMAGSAEDESSWQSNVGACCLLLCICATPVYFLIMDFLWADAADRRARAVSAVQPNPYTSGVMPGPGPGRITGTPGVPGRPPYGYGQQQPRPQPPRPRPQPQPPRPQPSATPVPPVPPVAPTPPAGATPPAGPRIHQVRAELDELSDFLRKEEGR